MRVTFIVIVLVSQSEEDVPGVNEANKRRDKGTCHCEDEDIFGQSTNSEDVLIFDVVVDEDGDEDGVDGLGDDGLDGDAHLVVVHRVDFFNHG